jgi:outer membrane protein TolC
VLAAEARVDKATSLFLPDLTLTGTYMRRLESTSVMGNVIQDQNALAGQVMLELSLFDGRAFPLMRQAKLDRDAQRLESRDDKRRVAFDTASAFLATMGQERVVTAAGARVELARKNLTDARYRVEAGFVGSNELTRVELEAAAAERDHTTAVATLRRARLQLGYLIDAEVNDMLVVPRDFYKDAFFGAVEASNDKPRLDVAAQQKRAEALDASAEEPSYRMLPKAALTATGRATNEGGFSGRDLDAAVGVTLTWTLYDGGERYADRDERLALAAAQRLTAEETERFARTEVKAAIVTLERGRAGLKEAERVAEIARRNAAETSELFRQGLVTSLAVTDATVSLFDAEVELSTARYETGIGLLELRLALGHDPFGKDPAP